MSEIAEIIAVDDQIREFRRKRVTAVQKALKSLRCDDPVVEGADLSDFAIANEVAVGVRNHLADSAASPSAGEVESLCGQYLRSVREHAQEIGGVTTIRCAGLDEDQCMFTPGVAIETIGPRESELVAGALAVLSETGTRSCFADTAGLIVVLGIAEPGAPVATWATGALPSVVHLHLMPRAELVARDLIHEATHTYLNDWLMARDVQLDATKPLFWSPWKDAYRPLFGFVHSIMAFSVVTAFLRRVALLPGSDRTWLQAFLEHELERLRSCAQSVPKTADMVPAGLQQKLETVYALATD